MLCVQDITTLCVTAVWLSGKTPFIWSTSWKQLVAECEIQLHRRREGIVMLVEWISVDFLNHLLFFLNPIFVFVVFLLPLIWYKHLMIHTVSAIPDLYPHCQIDLTAVKLLLPTISLTAASCVCCDKECVDSGSNPWDRCDGGNSDMYPWWQCRGVWQP